VKVNLQDMEDIEDCQSRVLSEALNANGQVIYNIQTARDDSTACIHILDLSTLHPNAKGFRKGFLGYPYGYLSPGQFNVPVRLNLVNFTLSTASYIDLGINYHNYENYCYDLGLAMMMMTMMMMMMMMMIKITIIEAVLENDHDMTSSPT